MSHITSSFYLRSAFIDIFFFFFLNNPAPTEISPLPLPDALPICLRVPATKGHDAPAGPQLPADPGPRANLMLCYVIGDRKSTRLNSSHGYISYAVFCLKKKKKNKTEIISIK